MRGRARGRVRVRFRVGPARRGRMYSVTSRGRREYHKTGCEYVRKGYRGECKGCSRMRVICYDML